MAVLVSSGALAGRWLDTKWGTAPWLILLGTILGTAAGFVNMFRVLAWWRKQGDGSSDLPR